MTPCSAVLLGAQCGCNRQCIMVDTHCHGRCSCQGEGRQRAQVSWQRCAAWESAVSAVQENSPGPLSATDRRRLTWYVHQMWPHLAYLQPTPFALVTAM